MKRESFLKTALLSIVALSCSFSTDWALSRDGRQAHIMKKKGNKGSSKNSCRRNGGCKGKSSKNGYKSLDDTPTPVKIVKGLDGKDGRDGRPGKDGFPCDCSRDQKSYISASSNEVQAYKSVDKYQAITFNQKGESEGWKHELGSANFTCPETAAYEVSYTAGVAMLRETTHKGVVIRAMFGPLGAEEKVEGSETGNYGSNFLKSTNTRFLLKGVAGQNFKLEFLGDDETCQLSAIGDAETTVSLLINRV